MNLAILDGRLSLQDAKQTRNELFGDFEVSEKQTQEQNYSSIFQISVRNNNFMI